MTHLARKAALVLVVFMGAFLGSGAIGYSQQASQQCYYRIGIDPANSCTGCADTCLGDGYKCCKIVVES